MKRESIAMLVKAMDAENAERILKDETIRREFRIIGKYIRKGDLQGATFVFRRLRDRIRWWTENRLTPERVRVGDGVTVNLYTDRLAATVVRVTKRTVTVRRDKATLKPGFQPEYLEGTMYCTNGNKQAYIYRPDPNGAEYTLYWSEKYQMYGQPDDLTLSKGRHEFYDYNF